MSEKLHVPTLAAVCKLCEALVIPGKPTRVVDAYNKALADVCESLAAAIAKVGT